MAFVVVVLVEGVFIEIPGIFVVDYEKSVVNYCKRRARYLGISVEGCRMISRLG